MNSLLQYRWTRKYLCILIWITSMKSFKVNFFIIINCILFSVHSSPNLYENFITTLELRWISMNELRKRTITSICWLIFCLSSASCFSHCLYNSNWQINILDEHQIILFFIFFCVETSICIKVVTLTSILFQ